MALTQKEISHKCYQRRKDNGLCPRCGKKLDRTGHYCFECLEKQRNYNREIRDFCRKNHICTQCKKEKVFGSDKICFECRAKLNDSRKPLTQEQKRKGAERFKTQQKSLYQERKEKGICTRCGKRKTDYGKAKCRICLNKDAEVHRNKNGIHERTDRAKRGICFFCDRPVEPGYKVCKVHHQKNIESANCENAKIAREKLKKEGVIW